MPNYRLTIEYDGSRYRGWQPQKNTSHTVMEAVRGALGAAGAEVEEIGGAGRTDAGVHALAQVAHVRLRRPQDADRLRGEVNRHLPFDIHVLALEATGDRFHSRHHAVARSYLYQLARRRSAFAKPFVWWVRTPLEIATLRTAAEHFVGRHDFARFCVAPGRQRSTVLEVAAVEVAEVGDLVLVRVVASHFLWRMVRRMVGALVHHAAGQLPLADLDRLLAGEEVAIGDPARWTAPASGLFLERVLYRDDVLPPLAPAVAVAREADFAVGESPVAG